MMICGDKKMTFCRYMVYSIIGGLMGGVVGAYLGFGVYVVTDSIGYAVAGGGFVCYWFSRIFWATVLNKNEI